MISPVGLDTTLLVAHTVLEHPKHDFARRHCSRLIKEDRLLALCPTVIDEFLHVVTDRRRFERPLSMADAIEISDNWLSATETVCFSPCSKSTRLHLNLLQEHRLGRKRINDTRIASIYLQNGVTQILTDDTRDYSVFGCFEILAVDEKS